ncbi:hypothetical protein HLI18_31360 [Rhizobium laguerreae]|uniref:hypothetical protein n=1 Tax=Rhizobium laguerreae TaxID=1076926 RepID=UPI001478A064|nr:hypothetical protein [Rhizobium laguerreae]NNG74284.1 hypothetical protein [Rhizobium laguerreae]
MLLVVMYSGNLAQFFLALSGGSLVAFCCLADDHPPLERNGSVNWALYQNTGSYTINSIGDVPWKVSSWSGGEGNCPGDPHKSWLQFAEEVKTRDEIDEDLLILFRGGYYDIVEAIAAQGGNTCEPGNRNPAKGQLIVRGTIRAKVAGYGLMLAADYREEPGKETAPVTIQVFNDANDIPLQTYKMDSNNRRMRVVIAGAKKAAIPKEEIAFGSYLRVEYRLSTSIESPDPDVKKQIYNTFSIGVWTGFECSGPDSWCITE